MADDNLSMTLARRDLLLAAPTTAALLLLRPSRASAEDPDPPAFRSGRGQFIIERPRNSLVPLKLQDVTGKDVTVSPKPGHVTLVNLWATWCAACRTDLPTLAALDRMRLPRLEIWTICTDRRDIKTFRRYTQEITTPRFTYADPYEQATQPAHPDTSTFAVPAIPITYLIGNNGLIEGYITGAAEWLSPAGQALLLYYMDRPAG